MQSRRLIRIISAIAWCCWLASGQAPFRRLDPVAAAELPPVDRPAKRFQRVLEAVVPGIFLLQKRMDDGSRVMAGFDGKFDFFLGGGKPGYVGEPADLVGRVYATEDQARSGLASPGFGLDLTRDPDFDDINPAASFPALPGVTLVLISPKPPATTFLSSGGQFQVFAIGDVVSVVRWKNVIFTVEAVRYSTTGYSLRDSDKPDVQMKQAAETEAFNKELEKYVLETSQTIYSTLDQLQQRLDAQPAVDTQGSALVAGAGTENEIRWDPAPPRLPAFQEAGGPPVTFAPIQALPVLGPTGASAGGGQYSADWSLSPTSGLTVERVRFTQTEILPGDGPLVDPVHRMAEYLQWRNYRVFFEGPDGQRLGAERPISLTPGDCTDLYRITQPGVRTTDGKEFSWAVVAVYYPPLIDPPSPMGTVKYLLEITQMFLFGPPKADQEPAGVAVALKGFPLLTVKVVPLLDYGSPVPQPSFAADLKMVFMPRLTRDDQHRPPRPGNPKTGDPPVSRYLPVSRQNTNVVNVVTDTNDPMRPVIGAPGQLAGGVLAPVPSYWDFIFDYLQPDIQQEMAFDAVIYPRDQTNTEPFVVPWPGANYHLPGGFLPDSILAGLKKGQLDMRRTPGQGEFDNLHIHPYVGFDDPSDASATGDQSRAMIEAPAAADEVIHMHWRWGLQIPLAASRERADEFRGYSDVGGLAHNQAGAPMIPPNQSLRIAIGRPEEESPVDPVPAPAPSLALMQTAVWYRATVHQASFGEPSPFCVHGFGLAYHLNSLGFGWDIFPTKVTNQDLLGDPLVVPGYHNWRWTNVPLTTNVQRIPSASDIPGLQRNHLIK